MARMTKAEEDAVELTGAIAVLAPRLEWTLIEKAILDKIIAAEKRGARKKDDK